MVVDHKDITDIIQFAKHEANFGLIYMNSSLMHGLFSREIFLDNGEKLVIKNMLGHAEDIYWRW